LSSVRLVGLLTIPLVQELWFFDNVETRMEAKEIADEEEFTLANPDECPLGCPSRVSFFIERYLILLYQLM